MEKKSKSEIKKLVAELHAKRNGGDANKSQHADQVAAGKETRSAAHNKTYRPKI